MQIVKIEGIVPTGAHGFRRGLRCHCLVLLMRDYTHVSETICVVRAPIVEGDIAKDEMLVVPDSSVSFESLNEVFASSIFERNKRKEATCCGNTITHLVVRDESRPNSFFKKLLNKRTARLEILGPGVMGEPDIANLS
jgi:hypothetical protein